jgi:hypothetical protein
VDVKPNDLCREWMLAGEIFRTLNTTLPWRKRHRVIIQRDGELGQCAAVKCMAAPSTCQWSYRYNFMWIDSIPP